MLSAKLIFLCTILALFLVTASLPVPEGDEMSISAPVDEVKMEQANERKYSTPNYPSGSRTVKHQFVLKDSLIG